MRRIGTALLLIGALALGLTLPWLVTMQKEFRDEAAGIQQVDLTADSGLSVLEKIGLLADSESSLLAVGIGFTAYRALPDGGHAVGGLLEGAGPAAEFLRHPPFADGDGGPGAADGLSDLPGGGGVPLLGGDLRGRSGRDSAAVPGRRDGKPAGPGLERRGRIRQDDERGLCGLVYGGPLDALRRQRAQPRERQPGPRRDGAEAEAVEAAEAEEAAQKDGLAVESPANYEVNRVTYAGAYTLTDDAAAAQVTIGIESGYGWLYVNSTHLS